MVLVSPPERTGKGYDRHAASTVYPLFAAERGVRRVDRAEDACRRGRRCASTWRRRICRPCRRRGGRARWRSDLYLPAVAAVARGGSCELAQAAAYCDQDLGAVGGRAWRGGLPFHGDATGGTDRAGVALLAARLAEGVTGIEYDDDRPDPGEYDIASAGDAGVQGGGRRARRRTKGSTRRPASCSSPRRASTSSPAGPRPARSTPSTACPTRNWRTGNARSTTGSCAAPGSPSSRASTATTSRTPGFPTATRPVGLLGLGFIQRAQDLVFYGKTGRGKTHLAIGLGMKAIDMGLGVRFHQTAELVLQPGKAKRDGTLETMPGNTASQPGK